MNSNWVMDPRVRSFISKAMSFIRSMDLDSLPKPESEFMSLTTQMMSLFRSMDLDSQPKPLSELISLISQNIHDLSMYLDKKLLFDFTSLVRGTLELEPEPELMSLIHQIFSLVLSMKSSKWEKLISLSPQAEIKFEEGNFQVVEAPLWRSKNKWECFPLAWETYSLSGEHTTHFRCKNCNGENHKEYNKASVDIKHDLHQKHPLQLVLLHLQSERRRCSCCDEYLKKIFYYCLVCDFAMNLACAEKPPVLLSIHRPRWHGHTLALFPRKNSLTCDVCGLIHSSGLYYMCPPCDFVIHQSCLSLPCVIRISRHPHRIHFNPYFHQGDWSCGVCRTKINNKYGGYSCIKEGCPYAAHSKCATQSNVWDGQELEGVQEDGDEEELEPFFRINDGVIIHFLHQHHHLRLDKDTGRDYDENRQCQACITPIYFGNFYSCLQCDFILHEECANLSRKIYHAIHPHQLTLVSGYEGTLDFENDICSACIWLCKAGFFYECGKEGCDFQLHVQCATTSEPLVHKSHMHPLFLTSKPGDKKRSCLACNGLLGFCDKETFNCIKCDFALCFTCATLPQKVRYKYDNHALTLSYGTNTSDVISWCEVCEREIKVERRFYTCDEYCCVTIHIECMLGFNFFDLHMKAGSSGFYQGKKLAVLPNNHHMSRPICASCKQRCPRKIVFKWSGLIFCSRVCVFRACC